MSLQCCVAKGLTLQAPNIAPRGCSCPFGRACIRASRTLTHRRRLHSSAQIRGCWQRTPCFPAQDGYFTQPSREAASALRHRWVAAMALVAVHALLIVSLLLVHAAVKATSVPAVSGGVAGLEQQLLEMPQRIEDVLEAAVEDAEDNEPGLTAEQRQARDRDKAATGPAAAAEAEPVDTGKGDPQREPGAAGAAASAAGTQAGAADSAQGVGQGEQQAEEVAAEGGQGRRLLGASLSPEAPVDSRSVDEAWLVASQGASTPGAAAAAPCADEPVRAIVLQQRRPNGAAAAPALASLSLRSFAGDLGGSKDAAAAAAAPAGGAAPLVAGLGSGSAEDGGRVMRLYATTPVDAAAVCNDGSPGAFYHRPGVGDGADKCAAAPSPAVPLNDLFSQRWSGACCASALSHMGCLEHRAPLGCCLWLAQAWRAEVPGPKPKDNNQPCPCRWVIRFLGGAWCWDAPSCATRWVSTPYLMSTLLLPPVTSATAHVDGLPDVVLQVPPAHV